VVDDDELIQSSALAILEVLGHRALGVTSGEEALARLEAGLRPDVVLLDLNMPGLGGAGTLPRLRALAAEVYIGIRTDVEVTNRFNKQMDLHRRQNAT